MDAENTRPQEEQASQTVEPMPEVQTPSPDPAPADPQPVVVAPTEAAKTFISEAGGGFFSKLKTIFIVLLVLSILTGGVFAFFKFLLPRFAKPQEVTLTYWGLWEEENIINEAISEYQKTHPNVKITYVFQSPRDYRERLQSALARGEGPDIFRFHNTWVPMFKTELSPVPASVFDAASFESAFYPVARNDLRQGNSYVGVPLEIDGLGLFVNEDIFRAAGKSFPKTWDELRQTALELTVKDSQGKIQIAGIALGRTENVDHWSDILGLMMLQNGVDLTNPTGILAEDALTYFTIFSEKDQVWDQTLPPSTTAFATGRLAMYLAPSWRVFEIKKANPNLSFTVVPVPQLQQTNVTWASYWVEGVSKKSAFEKEAWEFVKYLSSKETLAKLYQNAAKTRLFGEPYSRTDMSAQIKEDQYAGAFVTQATAARSWYLASRTFDNGINDKMIKYFEDAVNAVNQGQSAEKALQTLNMGVSQVLSQYGLASPVVR